MPSCGPAASRGRGFLGVLVPLLENLLATLAICPTVEAISRLDNGLADKRDLANQLLHVLGRGVNARCEQSAGILHRIKRLVGDPLGLSLRCIRIAVVERWHFRGVGCELLLLLLCGLLVRLLLLELCNLLLGQGAIAIRLVLVQLGQHGIYLGAAFLERAQVWAGDSLGGGQAFGDRLLALRLGDVAASAIKEALSLAQNLDAIGAGLGSPLLPVVPAEVRRDRLLHGVALIQTGFQLFSGGIDRLHGIVWVDAHGLCSRWDVLHQALCAAVLGGLPHGGGVETRLLLRQCHEHVDRHPVLRGCGAKVGLKRDIARLECLLRLALLLE